MKKLKNIIENKHLKEILSGSLITFCLSLAGMLLSYLVMLALTKKFGAAAFGIFTTLLSFITLAGTLSTIGTNISVLRFVGQLNSSTEDYAVLLLYKSLIKIILPISTLMALCVYFLSNKIANNYFEMPSLDYSVKLTSILIPFASLLVLNIEFIRGLKMVRYSEFLRSVCRNIIILIILSPIFFKFINNITSPIIIVVDVLLISVFVTSLLSIFIVIRYFIKLNTKLRSKEGLEVESLSIREIVKTSFPLFIVTGCSTALGSIGFFILPLYSSASSVGVFSVAIKISMLSGLILIIINTIAAPKFSELFWSRQINELQKTINLSTKLSVIFSIIPSLLIFFYPEKILGLFGKEFIEAKIILIILTIEQLINSMTGSAGLLLTMTGLEKVAQKIMISGFTFAVITNIVLIKTYGLLGAAISMLLTSILIRSLNVYHVKKRLGLSTVNFLK
ncbi:oligosaccharide flippase family protein [Methylophilus methylotrophus]|uniref:oligosaccharide flippase family protein n=1 Tax=Methylophilus methylotrophus TaxID=17 RepID=UPI000F5A894C|nr:oligosaccharide flippase family protein [Methylophilus methylotrophus]